MGDLSRGGGQMAILNAKNTINNLGNKSSRMNKGFGIPYNENRINTK